MKAVTLNLCAWIMLPFMDAIAKYLSTDLSFFQITWARYFFTVFFTLPFMFFFFRKKLIWTTQPMLQFLRGLLLFFQKKINLDLRTQITVFKRVNFIFC